MFFFSWRMYLELIMKETTQRKTIIYHSNAFDFYGSILSKHLTSYICNILPLTFPMAGRELLCDPLVACSNVYGMTVVRV